MPLLFNNIINVELKLEDIHRYLNILLIRSTFLFRMNVLILLLLLLCICEINN